MTPEYETIDLISDTAQADDEDTGVTYSEEFHLDGVSDSVKTIYSYIKGESLSTDESLIFNPQKYYISIKQKKNLAYLKIRKKKIRLIPLMREDAIAELVKHYKITHLSEGVQAFYNSPCAAIDIDTVENIDEIMEVLRILIHNE